MMISLKAALEIIADHLNPLERETIALDEGLGRILREDISASSDQPPFHASAMDGYACLAADLQKLPVNLTQIGTSQAGTRFEKQIEQGQTVRIFTGAPLPSCADTIIIQENTSVDGDQVTIHPCIPNPNHIRAKGYDYKSGQLLLKQGTRLTPRDLMLAASLNKAKLSVASKPKLAIIATGDELVAPGDTPNENQIISSVPFGLKPMFEALGCEVTLLGIAEDSIDLLSNKLSLVDEYDLVMTIGGASVGAYDFLHDALERSHVSVLFHKLALRPGKPLTFGMKGSQAYLGLPGNPTSALLCARLVGVPIFHHLTKGSFQGHEFSHAKLGSDLGVNGARLHFMRATLTQDTNGQAIVIPARSQDSSLQSTLAKSDCLIVRPANAPELSKDETVQVMKIDF